MWRCWCIFLSSLWNFESSHEIVLIASRCYPISMQVGDHGVRALSNTGGSEGQMTSGSTNQVGATGQMVVCLVSKTGTNDIDSDATGELSWADGGSGGTVNRGWAPLRCCVRGSGRSLPHRRPPGDRHYHQFPHVQSLQSSTFLRAAYHHQCGHALRITQYLISCFLPA